MQQKKSSVRECFFLVSKRRGGVCGLWPILWVQALQGAKLLRCEAAA